MEINEMKNKILEKVKRDKEILSSTNAEGNEQSPVEDNTSADAEGSEQFSGEENTPVNAEGNEQAPEKENTSSVSEDEKIQFQKAIAQLTNENEVSEKDLNESQNLVKTLESLMAQKEERLEGTQRQLDALNDEIPFLKDRVEKAEERALQFEEALREREHSDADHNEKAGEEIGSLRAKESEARQQVDILNEKLLSMKNEVEKKDIKISKLEDLLREKEDKLNAELHSEIEGVLSEIKLKFQMEESMSQLKAEVDSKNQKLNEILTTTENEINELKTKRDDQKSMLEAKGNKEKELEGENAALKIEIATRDSKIEADSKYFNELIKDAEEAKRDALLDIEAAAKETNLVLNKQFRPAGEERKMPEEESIWKSEFEEKIAQLESEIKEKNKKIEERSKEFEAMFSRIENSFKNNESEKGEISDQLESERKKNNELNERIKQSEKEKEIINLQNKYADIEEFNSWKKEVDGNFAVLQEELKQSLAEREDLEKELAEGMSMVKEAYAMLQDTELGDEEE